MAKLKAGPIWDFDWAWKNINECAIFAATDGSGWAYQVNDCYPDVNSPGWFVRLLQDPNFQNDIRCRWNTLRSGTLSLPYIFNYIDETATYLEQAQARHFEKWSNLGIPTGTPEIDPDPDTFAGQIAKFKSWIATRIAWLDDNMPGDPATCALSTTHTSTFNATLEPNPASNNLNIKSSTDTIKKIALWDVSGKVIFEQIVNTTERSIDLESIRDGIYFCKIENSQNAFVIKKVIIAH